jgi:hypothetical protein
MNTTQWHILNFAKSLIPVYGPTVNSQSLRKALLIFSGMVTSAGSFGLREAENLQDAIVVLRRKSPATFNEGDLFASFLLAFSSWARPDQQAEDYKAHLRGFIALLNHL